jgi:hypothetical protein
MIKLRRRYKQLMTISFCGTTYLYILERPSSWSTSRILPSWPQSRIELRILLLSFIINLLVCFGPPSILLSVPTALVSRSPFPVSWQLNTNVQVNNMAAPNHIYTQAHTYLYHIYITIHAPLHTSSTPLGRPAGSDSSRLSQ